MGLKNWIARLVDRLSEIARSLAPAPEPALVPVRVRRNER